jgi:hypothetical protein
MGSLAGGVLAGVFSAWLGTRVGLVMVLTLGGGCAGCSVFMVRKASRNLPEQEYARTPVTT